jgi:hypothetical protein
MKISILQLNFEVGDFESPTAHCRPVLMTGEG